MTSTTSSEILLEVSKLNLAFRLRRYRSRSARDSFVRFLGNPIESLLADSESLHVLRNVDLVLRKGDRLALIGINGSGKTTLCRCIAGMLQPGSGSIKFKPHARCQAIFDAQVGIIPELTGRENMHLLSRMLLPDRSREDLRSLTEDALEFSELGTFLDAPWETYSQGMKARLCLSLMTVLPPDILILDEVYDNTDQFFQKKMTARLQSFIESARAVIFVSHSPELLKKICNRAVVLHHGQVAFDGSVEAALNAYAFLNQSASPIGGPPHA